MKQQMLGITYEIDLQPGEKLQLPDAMAATVGPGRWLLSIQPAPTVSGKPVRQHQGFLNSYAPEDEGLYDDCPTR
jgi:hypothetical protein